MNEGNVPARLRLCFSNSPEAIEAFLDNIRNVMNFQTLDEDLKCLWLTGNSLTLEERMQVKLSLLELVKKEDFDDILFWGKIKGITRDYFLGMGLKYQGQYEFPQKRFFWCNSVTWSF